MDDDQRKEDVNSGGKQVIFTCASRETALKLLELVKDVKEKLDEKIKEDSTISQKLSKGMMAYVKDKNQIANIKKYVESGRSIQVFGLD